MTAKGKKDFRHKSKNRSNDVKETNRTDEDEESQEEYADPSKETDESEEDNNEPALSAEVLYERLEEAEKEKEELNDRLLRTIAELNKKKKRVTREKGNLIKYGAEKMAFELLAVADNFERALEQAREANEIQSVVEGIEMILKQFVGVLEKFHIKSFNSVGEQFDPEKHEAMAQQEHAEHEENTIISEFQKGYFLNDRLLRPARVIVSKSPSKKKEEGSDPGCEEENGEE